jgi:hypothetical protein
MHKQLPRKGSPRRERVKGRHHAKVVMVKSGRSNLMVVLPAEHLIDTWELAKIVGQDIALEPEWEFESSLPRLRGRSNAALWQSLRSVHVRGQEFG